jgi:hypothetical protein
VCLSLGAQRSNSVVCWDATNIRHPEKPLLPEIRVFARSNSITTTYPPRKLILFPDSFYDRMGWFRLGKQKGLTPGPGHQNAADEPLSSHAAAYLSNTNPDNVAPVEYPSPDQRSRSTQSSFPRGGKCDLLASWLLSKAEERMWIEGRPGQGVFVKKHKGIYAHSPDHSNDNSGLHEAIIALNVRVCLLLASIIH